MKDARFAKWNDFNKVIEFFKSSGFEFLAKVTMSTREVPYYILVKEARETYLFFYAQGGKSMFFCLTCAEYVDEDNVYRTYWKLELAYKYDFLKWYQRRLKEVDSNDWDRIPDFIDTRDIFELNGIRCSGATHEVDDYETDFLAAWSFPKSFQTALISVKERLEPYLYHKFKELSMFYYAPSYTFGKSLDLFWSKFPWHRLNEVALRFNK